MKRRQDWAAAFALYLAKEGLRPHTCVYYAADVGMLAQALKRRGIALPQARAEDIRRYLKTAGGRNLGKAARAWTSFRRFYNYLAARRVVQSNPMLEIPARPRGKPLRPPEFLDADDIGKLFAAADAGHGAVAMRNAVMLRLMYSCGLTASETAGMKLGQLRVAGNGGHVRVLSAYGKRTGEKIMRKVCVNGDMARRCLRYVAKVRPDFARRMDGGGLFLTARGKDMTPQIVWQIVKQYAKRAGIAKPLSPRILRHSFALHLVQQGADLESLRIILGVTSRETCKQYAMQAIRQSANIAPTGVDFTSEI